MSASVWGMRALSGKSVRPNFLRSLPLLLVLLVDVVEEKVLCGDAWLSYNVEDMPEVESELSAVEEVEKALSSGTYGIIRNAEEGFFVCLEDRCSCCLALVLVVCVDCNCLTTTGDWSGKPGCGNVDGNGCF